MPSLPVTGGSIAPIAATGGAALIAGIALLRAGRRKPR
ncbi:LPXTG cell wall anchor domain-containing protein [Micromonospora sp. MED01]|nr:LPXTG cell wall anchor domain-containing protein [Micromonospora alfalfae]MCG5466657.1 LPXTG cell wall anchor domain-containing protein [Micromonospora alfalfae]